MHARPHPPAVTRRGRQSPAGAGYSDDEFAAFGLDVPSPTEKITGLKEAVSVIRGLWSEQRFSLSGQRHRTEAADIEPEPAHPIPIWLGSDSAPCR